MKKLKTLCCALTIITLFGCSVKPISSEIKSTTKSEPVVDAASSESAQDNNTSESGGFVIDRAGKKEGDYVEIKSPAGDRKMEDSPDGLDSVDPEILPRVLSSDKTGVKIPSGILMRENDMVVSDKETNKLYVLDFEGTVIKEIGKLGIAPMEFSQPTDLFWNETSETLYVLDSENERVQKLDKNLEYIGEIPLPKREAGDFYISIVADDNGELYVARNSLFRVKTNIIVVQKDGTVKEIDKFFVGSLAANKGKIYACEKYELHGVFLGISEEYDTTKAGSGYSYLYEVKDYKLVEKALFPFQYTPNDIVLSGNSIYSVSKLWNEADEFELQDGKINFVRALTPQYEFAEPGNEYTLSFNGKQLGLADAGSGNIYIVETT